MNDPMLAPANVTRARLPELYLKAQRALQTCAKLDECRDWANRAVALASYARQSKDNALRVYAERIQARAVRRCGELLRQVPQARGKHWESKRGCAPPSTRSGVAREAGMSDDQRKTALRIANIPERQFEQLLESDSPPSVTALAELGRTGKLKPPPDPFVEALKRANKEFASFDIQQAVRRVDQKGRHEIGRQIQKLWIWSGEVADLMNARWEELGTP